VARFIDELKRTHDCGALRAQDLESEVVLFGWVAARRDHGNLIFVDLRDREGITQLLFDPGTSSEAHHLAESLRPEWVIGVRGRVRLRGQQFSAKEQKLVSAVNEKLPTGAIEV
jgi:aspartyl-tRNA synthetase